MHILDSEPELQAVRFGYVFRQKLKKVEGQLQEVNVSATVPYGKKELLDNRPAITHLGLDKDFFFNKQDAQDILRTTRQGHHPSYLQEEETQVQRTQSGVPRKDPQKASEKAAVTINITHQRASMDNKLDEVRSQISYQWDIKNCNILCFKESWLNDAMDIQLAGYTLHRQDRTAHSGKTRGEVCEYL